MCGVVGYSGSGNPTYLEKAVRSLKHRGPDGEGIFFSENKKVGLGHTRLAIQDFGESGVQPMYSNCGRFVLSYNGEIYNHRELRNVCKHDYNFKTDSDCEVILSMYQKYGKNFVHKLNGIFAFAIYDKKQKTVFFDY